jgi:uncharacterized membrane protein YkvA (DUF1232 family)
LSFHILDPANDGFALRSYPPWGQPRIAALGAEGVVTSLEDYARELQLRAAEPRSASTGELQGSGWKSRARKPLIDVCTVYLVLKHPQAPIAAKAVAAVTIGYVLSPIQLIPSFIPVIGWMDDLLVIWLGGKLLRALTPDTILVTCQANAVALAMRLLRSEATPSVGDPKANAVTP